MKKSVLWTAAGVVTATAIWAAISLPQRTVHCNKNATVAVQAPPTQSTLTIQGPNASILAPLAESQTFSWDGCTATITRDHGIRRVRAQWGTSPQPVTITVTKQVVENGPHYYSRSTTSYNRLVQVGESFQL
ncbi:hypothetical protein [Armatimonas rosea]|uniref:Uncharacterized protein n=1 Tax=Armatimonas rosea TaxID=685828 RepID=A0A7W9W898_ARMRO|nr:hypothetical protein [Armatimonas rosea]MBB6051392.1 hypothetical protein [Armatimonas rosea]